MSTSAPRVNSATMPAAASPAAMPANVPATGCPLTPPPIAPPVVPAGTVTRGNLAHIASLVAFFFNGAFAVALHLLLAGARKAVDQAGNLHHRAVGKDHGGEVHVELRMPFHMPGALHAIHHALHVHARRNQHVISHHHRKGRSQVHAVARPWRSWCSPSCAAGAAPWCPPAPGRSSSPESPPPDDHRGALPDGSTPPDRGGGRWMAAGSARTAHRSAQPAAATAGLAVERARRCLLFLGPSPTRTHRHQPRNANVIHGRNGIASSPSVPIAPSLPQSAGLIPIDGISHTRIALNLPRSRQIPYTSSHAFRAEFAVRWRNHGIRDRLPVAECRRIHPPVRRCPSRS